MTTEPIKKGFLQGGDGKNSAMRLLCIQSWWAAFLLTVMLLFVPLEQERLEWYCLLSAGFLITAFGGKVGQKILERRPPP